MNENTQLYKEVVYTLKIKHRLKILPPCSIISKQGIFSSSLFSPSIAHDNTTRALVYEITLFDLVLNSNNNKNNNNSLAYIFELLLNIEKKESYYILLMYTINTKVN